MDMDDSLLCMVDSSMLGNIGVTFRSKARKKKGQNVFFHSDPFGTLDVDENRTLDQFSLCILGNTFEPSPT